MLRQSIKEANDLRRREIIPKGEKTPERDKAADWIEENVIDEGRWGEITFQQMGEESPWSRQHISNTLDAYFEPASKSDTEGVTMDYRQGFKDGVRTVKDDPEAFGLTERDT